ncbi:interleukin-12 receptor subunit beta-2 isoform X3 [Ictidomys tridecemlineatus]
MARTLGGCSLELVFLTMWLLIKAHVDVCTKGDVTVKPSDIISHGSTVNISCSLKPKQDCLPSSRLNTLVLYKIDKKIGHYPGRSISIQVSDLSLGSTLFRCRLACGRSYETPVCGAEILVGVAPERPQNLTCTQKGEHGTVACTWEKGQETYIYTKFTLQLNGPKNLTQKKHCSNCNCLDLGIRLSPELSESSFMATVTATNSLGSSSSFPSTFTFLDIEPTGTLDVWYMKQAVDFDRQQISLFWKNLSVSETRGKILHYQVTLQEVTGKKITLQNITGHNFWTWVIPRTGIWTVAVSAANSKGSSLPTRINITDLCGSGLLAPHQVSAYSEDVGGIVVTWQAPEKAASAVQQYVVEWRALHLVGSTQPPPSWLWVPPYNMSALISENIKPYVCYEIRVHALSRDQGGCSSIWGSSKYKAPLKGPHINAIVEEKGSILISWNHIPVQEQMGCILHYRIYWKERDSSSQPGLCEIPYSLSQNSYLINSLQPRVTYILWMTALTAAGESPQGNEREFSPQGKASWNMFMTPSICIAIIMVGVFSLRYFRQKAFVLLSLLRPQWCSRDIPDPANSTWAKKYPIMEEKTQLPLDKLQISWSTPEEPEPLVINEVLHQMTPVFRHPHCLKWPVRGQGVQGYFTSKEDTVYSASSPLSSRALKAETRQLVDLYKVLESKDTGSKAGKITSPLTVLPGDYLPSHEGYLPSNIDDLPSHEVPLADQLEELEPQHISLSVFMSSSLHPLNFSCGEKLTLDQLKMGCDSLIL